MPSKDLMALIVQNGSILLGQFIRNRPVTVKYDPQPASVPDQRREQRDTEDSRAFTETFKSFKGQDEKDYRFECCTKHLSTAAGIFKEAVDRCVGNGFDSGVVEKVREAMSVLNAMEADLTVMNGMPEIAGDVRTLEDGMRKLRKAVWSARLETDGMGNRETDLSNIEGALKWTRTLLNTAYDSARRHQGGTCALKI